ncbi:MAG: hypothetical protein ACTHLD_13835, partial [Chitinophaga sp.]
MVKWLLTGCIILALHQPGQAQNGHIYLSPAGSDGNPGTKEKPLATLQGAQQRWRQLRTQQPGRQITVVLQAGTYYLSRTLVLTPEDNGLLITGAPGKQAVISGAAPLTVQWQAQSGGVYAAAVPASVKTMDRLYIGGQTQVLARYPNYDSAARFYHGTSADAL